MKFATLHQPSPAPITLGAQTIFTMPAKIEEKLPNAAD
jgi:hypothetical protein